MKKRHLIKNFAKAGVLAAMLNACSADLLKVDLTELKKTISTVNSGINSGIDTINTGIDAVNTGLDDITTRIPTGDFLLDRFFAEIGLDRTKMWEEKYSEKQTPEYLFGENSYTEFLTDWFENVLPRQKTEPPRDMYNDTLDVLTPTLKTEEERMLNDLYKKSLLEQIKHNPKWQELLPYDYRYLEDIILPQMSYHFANATAGADGNGNGWTGGGFRRTVLPINKGLTNFIHIAAHEDMHQFFGCDESLADWAATKLVNVKGETFSSDWVYDGDYFVRLLEEAAGGPEEIMRAVIRGNDAYGALWDKHFADTGITFEKMQLVTGLNKKIQSNYDLRKRFEAYSKYRDDAYIEFADMKFNFGNGLFYLKSTDEDIQNEGRECIRSFVDFLDRAYIFAEENDIHPTRAVMNEYMHSGMRPSVTTINPMDSDLSQDK